MLITKPTSYNVPTSTFFRTKVSLYQHQISLGQNIIQVLFTLTPVINFKVIKC